MIAPVVASLRAEFGQFRASVVDAREQWGETTAAIRGTTQANLAAGSQMERLAEHSAHGAQSMSGLREQSAAAMTSIRGGLASVIPGLGEMAEAIGLSREAWREQKVAAVESLRAAKSQTEVLRLELVRVETGLAAVETKMLELAPGSRSFDVANAKAVGFRDQIALLNAELARSVKLERAAGAEAGLQGGARRVGRGLRNVVGGAAIAGAFVGYEGVKQAINQEASLELLRTAVSKTKTSFESLEPALESVQGQMRGLGFRNNETTESAARLTQMLGNPTKALNLVGLAANLARARHLDLATATNIVGKAATGHVALLARYGFATKDAAGHTLSAKAAIQKMADTFGGTASAYSTTLKGQLLVFRAQLDHILERVGVWLIPRLTELGHKFGELGGWIKANVLPVFAALRQEYDHHKTLVKTLAVGILAFVAAYKTLKIVTGIIAAVRNAQLALNLAMDANPIGMIVVAVVALAAALVYAWKHSETFRRVTLEVWSAVKNGVGEAVKAIINFYIRPVAQAYLWVARVIVGAVAHAFGWIPGLGPKLKAASRAVAEFAHDTDDTLKGWADAAGKWGAEATKSVSKSASAQMLVMAATKRYAEALADDMGPAQTARAKAALDAAKAYAAKVAAELKKKKLSGKTKKDAHAEGFDIGSGYADGISDAVAQHKKKAKAAKKAKKKDPKKAARDALAELRARLEAEKAAALAAAEKRYHAARLAAAAVLAAVREQLRQAQIELKLAGAQSRDLSLINGHVLDEGTSFAQFAQRGATNVTVNVGGSVTSERDLAAALAEALRRIARNSSGLGVT